MPPTPAPQGPPVRSILVRDMHEASSAALKAAVDIARSREAAMAARVPNRRTVRTRHVRASAPRKLCVKL
jgi:hypothetical protein